MKKFLSIVPRWFPALFMMIVIFVISSQSGNDLPSFRNWDYAIKKAGHALGYGLLALSYFHYLKYNARRYWLALSLALAYAITDEFHQSFVSGRHASIFDVVIFDGLGAFAALWIFSRFWSKHEEEIFTP
ncbi:VanZ family protein [Candidatus Villigracilis saccharophilus]|uniref:VanZ family protein n=1 Tax=Candidatus Villigracilis saccharophilus TaxID=3140684 RepID=UPI0031370BB0|nr:VanZ family protein [Anaerolineales bacterium]